MPRRSSRLSSAAASAKPNDAADDDKGSSLSENESSPTDNDVLKGAENPTADGAKKASPKKKKASPKKKTTTQTKRAKAKASSSDDEGDDSKPKAKKKKAADHQRWTERTPLARHWDPKRAMEEDGSYTFTVISWNVAGLRAFVKKQPDALSNLAERYDADVICLQEHKLQESHLDDKKLNLREYFSSKLGGYEDHWSFSTKKKGYSGTAMFIKKRGAGNGDGKSGGGEDGAKKGKKQPKLGAFFSSSKAVDGEGNGNVSDSTGDIDVSHLRPVNVETELGLPAHDGEGRTVTAEFPLFYLTNVYVPNSGQKLDRLGYRTEQWDADFLAKMQQLEGEGDKPLIWLGDLNVAHDEKDTWNEGAKHLAKSAGTTPEERASFGRQLGAGYVDAFRRLHPDGRGHYSYWSQRAGNREPNRGLRLDYFICSRELVEDGDGRKARVRDSYMCPDELGSDHCPIVLEIEIKK